jgi:hypothetical protein
MSTVNFNVIEGEIYLVCGTYTGTKAGIGTTDFNLLALGSSAASKLDFIPFDPGQAQRNATRYKISVITGGTIFGIGIADSTGAANVELGLFSNGADTTVATGDASLIVVGPISQ